MATIQKPLDDEQDENQPAGGGSGPAGPVNVSGTEAADNSATKPQNVASPEGTKSGSFQNIQKYLDANAGFNQGQGLAGKTYDNLKDQKEQQQNAIGGAQNEFNQNSQTAGQSYDPSKVQSFVNGVLQDPTKASDSDVNQYQKYLDAQYNGPNSLKGYGDLYGKAQNLAQTTGLVNSDSGRMALLNKLYNNGSYNQGQQSLDNLLISADQNQLNKLQSVRNFGSDVQGSLNNAQNQAQVQAQQYQDMANQAQTTSKDMFNNSVAGFNTDLGNRVSKAGIDNSTFIKQLRADLATGHLNQDEYNAIGGDKSGLKAGTKTYGQDLSSFISKNYIDPTMQNVAQSGDYARVAALNKLIGNNNITTPGSNQTLLQSLSDPSQANTYNTKGAQFNAGGATNVINAAKAPFDTKLANLDQQKATSQAQTSANIAALQQLANMGSSSAKKQIQAFIDAQNKFNNAIDTQVQDLNRSAGQGLNINGTTNPTAPTTTYGTVTSGVGIKGPGKMRPGE